jgi:uncharacterized protein YraI
MRKSQWGLIIAMLLLNYIIFSQAFRLFGSVASGQTIDPTATSLPTATPLGVAVQEFTPIPALPDLAAATPTNTPVLKADAQPSSSSASSETAAPAATNTPVMAQLAAASIVNVRSGPGMDYPVMGVLMEGQSAAVTGKTADGGWWQIAFEGSTEGKGWISASFVTATNTEQVPIAQSPPAPVSANPVPASIVNSPVPAIDTPQPTATPAPASPTNTPAPTATSKPSYKYSIRNVWGQTNEAITQIRGNIKDRSKNPVNGVQVRVRAGSDFCTVSYPSGKAGTYPEGNYDILLDNKAKDATWMVDIVEDGDVGPGSDCHSRKRLSETVNVTTDHVEGVTYVEWWKN